MTSASLLTPPLARPGHRGPVADWLASTRAELFRLRRWPAAWVVAAAWLALALVFGYVFNYVSYTTGESGFSNDGVPTGELLAEILPPAVPTVFVQGMPLFGGALMIVLGAMTAGNGYGWGTWKTVYTQGPRRVVVAAGMLTALLVWAAGLLATTVVACLGAATVIAVAEDQVITWPTMSALAESTASGYLVLAVWLLAGVLLGTLARSPALSVGLGIVWAVVVENLLRGVGGTISAIGTLTEWLPGTAAGSLVGALVGDSEGTPGVLSVLGQERATWVLAGYAVLLPVVTLALVHRRDVA